MRAATTIELRAFLRSPAQGLALVLVCIFPAMFALVDMARSALTGTAYNGWDYQSTYQLLAPVATMIVLIIAATVATNSHRHSVFQAYVSTGHPRDLLAVGRMAATTLLVLVAAIGSLTVGLLVHLATYTVPEGALASSRITNLPLHDVAADAAVYVALLVLLGLATAGLGCFTRSAGATAGAVIAVPFLEQGLVSALQVRASDRLLDTPLAGLAGAAGRLHDPWWSLSSALLKLVGRGPGLGTHTAHGLLPALGVVALWTLVAMTLGVYRIARSDA